MFLQAVLETVAKITHDKGKKNDTQVAKYGSCKIFLGANYCIFYHMFWDIVSFPFLSVQKWDSDVIYIFLSSLFSVELDLFNFKMYFL